MPWPEVRLHGKRLGNCAACWTNTKRTKRKKETADDCHFDEAVVTDRDAISGVGAAAFPVAGDGFGRSGRSLDGALAACASALCGRRHDPFTDAHRADRDLHAFLAAAFLSRGAFAAASLCWDLGERETPGDSFRSIFLIGIFLS